MGSQRGLSRQHRAQPQHRQVSPEQGWVCRPRVPPATLLPVLLTRCERCPSPTSWYLQTDEHVVGMKPILQLRGVAGPCSRPHSKQLRTEVKIEGKHVSCPNFLFTHCTQANILQP